MQYFNATCVNHELILPQMSSVHYDPDYDLFTVMSAYRVPLKTRFGNVENAI